MKKKTDNKSESDSDVAEDHGPGVADGKKTKFQLKSTHASDGCFVEIECW